MSNKELATRILYALAKEGLYKSPGKTLTEADMALAKARKIIIRELERQP